MEYPDPRHPFPTYYAFVVQFAGNTPLDANAIRGRVEHVASGRVGHFTSLEALYTFMREVLQTYNVPS